jgi:hypothetical protein
LYPELGRFTTFPEQTGTIEGFDYQGHSSNYSEGVRMYDQVAQPLGGITPLVPVDQNQDSVFIQLKEKTDVAITVKRDGVVIGKIPVGTNSYTVFKANGTKGNGTTPANQFQFITDNSNVTIPDITVEYPNQVIIISPTKIPFGSRGASVDVIGNTGASVSSFDPRYVTPIDWNLPWKADGSGGALKKQIFESLNDLDTDYYDNDGINMKNHFSYNPINGGEFTEKTNKVYGFEEFRRQISVDVAVDNIPIPKSPISVSASLGVTHESINSSRRESIFTYAKVNHKVYGLSINESQADLEDDFIRDIVYYLETPDVLYQDNETDSLRVRNLEGQSIYKNYMTFLQKWGTHYAKDVSYGCYGIRMRRSELNESTLIENTEVDIRAEVSVGPGDDAPGGGGGVNVQTGNTSTQGTENSDDYFKYVGGEASESGWVSADVSNSQPVNMSLSNISNLLIHDRMEGIGGVSSTSINKKKGLMNHMVDEFLLQSLPGNRANRKLVYTVKVENVTINACDDDGDENFDCEVFGNMYLSLKHTKDESILRDDIHFFKKKRDDAIDIKCNIGRALFSTSELETDQLELIKILDASSNPYIVIGTKLRERDEAGSDDYWGREKNKNNSERYTYNRINLSKSTGLTPYEKIVKNQNSEMSHELKITVTLSVTVEDINDYIRRTRG